MMTRWRFFELGAAAVLLFGGAALLYSGSSSRSANAEGILMGGAVFFSCGALFSVSAFRSFLWHRRMIQHAMPHRSTHAHRSLLYRWR